MKSLLRVIIAAMGLFCLTVLLRWWPRAEEDIPREATAIQTQAFSRPVVRTFDVDKKDTQRLDARHRDPVDHSSSAPPSGRFNAEVYIVASGPALSADKGLSVVMCSLPSDNCIELQPISGEWRGSLPATDHHVVAITGEDGYFEFAPQDSVLGPESPRLDLIISDQNQWTVSARDSETGAPLSTLTVLREAEPDDLDLGEVAASRIGPPEDAIIVTQEAPSPVDLPALRQATRYWVTATGYSWRSFLKTPWQQHVVVCLAPAGNLTVEVPSRNEWQVDGAATLDLSSRARRKGRGPLELMARDPVQGGEVFHFAKVPEGECLATLRKDFGTGTICAMATAHVGQDQEAVLVNFEWTNELELGELLVWVALPEFEHDMDWRFEIGIDEEELSVADDEGLASEDMMMWAVEAGVRSHRFTGLRPGDYDLRVLPVGWSEAVSLQAGARQEIALDMTATNVVVVDIEGATTMNEWLEVEWGYVGLCEKQEETRYVGRSGAARLACLPIPIWIKALGSRGSSRRIELTPVDRETHVQLFLEPELSSSLEVTVWFEGGRAWLGDDFWEEIVVKAVGHAGGLERIILGRDSGDACSEGCLVLSSPGHYTIDLPAWLRAEAVHAFVEPGRSKMGIVLN